MASTRSALSRTDLLSRCTSCASFVDPLGHFSHDRHQHAESYGERRDDRKQDERKAPRDNETDGHARHKLCQRLHTLAELLADGVLDV